MDKVLLRRVEAGAIVRFDNGRVAVVGPFTPHNFTDNGYTRLLRYAASDEATIYCSLDGPYVEVIYTSLAASYELMKNTPLAVKDAGILKRLVRDEADKALIEKYRGQSIDKIADALHGDRTLGEISQTAYTAIFTPAQPHGISAGVWNRVLEKAWVDGHSSGLHAVIDEITTLLDVIRGE